MADDLNAHSTTPAFASSRKKPAQNGLLKGLSKAGAWAIGAVVLAVLAFVLWMAFKPKDDADPYRFASVERGDIVKTVSASGTLEARETVNVGSQLSGLVSNVYVDFNDHVKKGQILVRIDPSSFQSSVNQSTAQLDAARANLGQQQANLVSAQAKANQAQLTWDRDRKLMDQGYLSQSAMDADNAALKSANASVSQAQAAVNASNANIEQSQASLHSSQFNLDRTEVVAPIDGVIIDRQIEPGQTVAASFSAPTLFIIAGDLSQLQAEILVDEADIGQVQSGQAVKFTVDAYPDQNFTGTVHQIRLQPQTQNGVVAYDVVVYADNPGGKLMPGMTANADIIINSYNGVLKVPSAALRFKPVDPNGKGVAFGGPPGGLAQAGNGGGSASRIIDQLNLTDAEKKKVQPILDQARADVQARVTAAGATADRHKLAHDAYAQAFQTIRPLLDPDQQKMLDALQAQADQGSMAAGVIYVLRNNKPVAVPIGIGASESAFTMIRSDQLKDGDQVIVGGGPHAKIDPKTMQGRRF